MSRFAFEAVDPAGKVQRGTVVAPDEESVTAQLSAQGLYLTRLGKDDSAALFQRRPSPEQLAGFMRSLAVLLQSGVPVDRALMALIPQVPARLRPLVERVVGRMRDGASLARAIGEEGCLPPVAGAILGVGERGSRLA